MSRKHIVIVLLSVLAMLCAGCTQNNGRIGDLFGAWALQNMTKNNEPLELQKDAEGAAISFQGNIVRFSLIFNAFEIYNNYATWIRTDDTLIFDFNNWSDDTDPGMGGYAPPYWFEMTELTEIVVINRLDNEHLDLVRYDNDGNIYIYNFERTW